jgi:hypothetical protein
MVRATRNEPLQFRTLNKNSHKNAFHFVSLRCHHLDPVDAVGLQLLRCCVRLVRHWKPYVVLTLLAAEKQYIACARSVSGSGHAINQSTGSTHQLEGAEGCESNNGESSLCAMSLSARSAMNEALRWTSTTRDTREAMVNNNNINNDISNQNSTDRFRKDLCVSGAHSGRNFGPMAPDPRAPSSFIFGWYTTANPNVPIVIQINRNWSPYGVDRFFQLLLDNYFDCATFFRVVPGTSITIVSLKRYLFIDCLIN